MTIPRQALDRHTEGLNKLGRLLLLPTRTYLSRFMDGSRDMIVENNIFVDVNATFNSGEGLTWDMHNQGQNSSAYYSKLRAVKARRRLF